MSRFEIEIENWKQAGKINKASKLDQLFKMFGYCIFQGQKLEKQLILMLASYFKHEKRKLPLEIDRIIARIKDKKLTLGELLQKEIKQNFDLTDKDYDLVRDTIILRNDLVHNYFDNKIALMESDEGQLMILRTFSDFYEKTEQCIDSLKKYYQNFASRYSIDLFEIESVYNNYLTNMESNIDKKLLILESDFFNENESLLNPTDSDFSDWLTTLPEYFAIQFKNRGLSKSKQTRDFQRFYFEKKKSLSLLEFFQKSGLSEEELIYWKTKDDDKIKAQKEIAQNPHLQKFFEDFNRGDDYINYSN